MKTVIRVLGFLAVAAVCAAALAASAYYVFDPKFAGNPKKPAGREQGGHADKANSLLHRYWWTTPLVETSKA